jgi:hypothetical protein
MQARYFSRNDPLRYVDPVDGGHPVDDGAEPRDPDFGQEDDAGAFDGVMPEIAPEHDVLSAKLVKQFQVRYNRNEVKWLKFPDRKLWMKYFSHVPYEPGNV